MRAGSIKANSNTHKVKRVLIVNTLSPLAWNLLIHETNDRSQQIMATELRVAGL